MFYTFFVVVGSHIYLAKDSFGRDRAILHLPNIREVFPCGYDLGKLESVVIVECNNHSLTHFFPSPESTFLLVSTKDHVQFFEHVQSVWQRY